MRDVEVAIEAAQRGAQAIRRHFRTDLAIDLKGAVDPVTLADREAEAAVVDVIRDSRPDDAVIAEEGTAFEGGRRRWVIDPLDGTVNFTKGIPHVGVSVGLEDDAGPLVGVVVDVFRDEVMWAERGGGSWLAETRLRVTGTTSLEAAVVATGFPYDRNRFGTDYAGVVGAMLHRVLGVRRMGAAALDLAWVAAGRYDGYWEWGLAPWDLLAGQLLVTEAGGSVTNAAGGPVSPTEVVASNGLIHEAFRTVVEAHRPPHRS